MGKRLQTSPFLLVLAGLGVACSGRLTDNSGNPGNGSSSGNSGSTSSGGNSGSDSSGSSGNVGGNSGSDGGNSSGGTGSNSGSGGETCMGADCCTLPMNACTEPPSPPTGPTTSLTTPHDYAIHKLFFGDTDRMGVSNPNAWETFGYDLDGRITTATSTDVCTLVPGASRIIQIDGDGGIDNSWGANVMPILLTLDSTFSQSENAAIQAGAPTQLFYVVGFDDASGNQTTATGLAGLTLATIQYSADGGAPTWDLNTHWPIAPELMTGCTLSGGCPAGTDPLQAAQIRFSGAFQQAGTFSSGAAGDVVLQLGVGGQPMTLTVHDATVTFDPSVPGTVTNGTVAGVLDTVELVSQLEIVAGRISTSLCSGSAFQSIAQQIQQTSDIVLNGSTVSNEPGTTCNAISMGIGFDATEIAIPTSADVAGPQPLPPDPCPDAGTD